MLASNLVLHLPLTIIRMTSAQVHERAPPAAITGWCAMQVSFYVGSVACRAVRLAGAGGNRVAGTGWRWVIGIVAVPSALFLTLLCTLPDRLPQTHHEPVLLTVPGAPQVDPATFKGSNHFWTE